MTGSLYRAGGWKPGPTNRPTTAARPYRRRDPRETAPDTDWWKQEAKTREEQLAINKERREREARLIHIPPKRV